MPVYRFRCATHGDFEVVQSMHDTTAAVPCPVEIDPVAGPCLAVSPKVLGVCLIQRAGLPSAGAGIQEFVDRERTWAKNHPAYRRLRAEGLRPKSIDSSAELEARADTRTEIEMGRVMPKKSVELGQALSSEILGHDCTV